MATPTHQNEPIGFAGLTTLVSNVPSGPPPRATPKPESQPPDQAPRPQTVQASSAAPQVPSRKSDSAFKLIAISIVVLAILGFIGVASDQKTTQYAGLPAPSQSPSPVVPAEPKSAPPAPYVTPKPPEIVEEMPDASTGYVERTFSRNQIYYCLAEKTRVEILRDRTGSTSQQKIDYLNNRVRDYNARCGLYKYFQPEMDAAQRQYNTNANVITTKYVASLSSPPEAKPPPPTGPVAVTPQPPRPSATGPWPSATTAPAIAIPPSTAPMTITEAVPPYGQGHRHSREELYYCFAESVRLEGAKQSIDMKSDTQVERLNNRQNEFNTRCTHFTSDPADREAVKKQLATKRAALKKQGVAIANGWR